MTGYAGWLYPHINGINGLVPGHGSGACRKSRSMTTFDRWSPSAKLLPARPDRKPKRYDIRVVDQFYGYCQAVERTHRHRDKAQVQSQFATRRNLGAMVLAGVLLCYYLVERFAQVAGLL